MATADTLTHSTSSHGMTKVSTSAASCSSLECAINDGIENGNVVRHSSSFSSHDGKPIFLKAAYKLQYRPKR